MVDNAVDRNQPGLLALTLVGNDDANFGPRPPCTCTSVLLSSQLWGSIFGSDYPLGMVPLPTAWTYHRDASLQGMLMRPGPNGLCIFIFNFRPHQYCTSRRGGWGIDLA